MQSQSQHHLMDLKQYSQKFLREFIETYRSLPELWKIRSKSYFDKGAKARAYDKLITMFKQVDPHADRDTVKRKINSLRTTFRKEWRKVQYTKSRSETGESLYKPSLWYYENLLFLCEQHQSIDDSPNSSPDHIIEINSRAKCKQEVLDLENEEFFDELSEDLNHDLDNNDTLQESFSESSHNKEVLPISSTSLHTSQLQTKEESMNVGTLHYSHSEDEFHYIAKVWAMKLRRMSAMQKLIAEKLVNDVLFEGELGTLSRSSHLNV